MPLANGEVFADYVIQRLLGSGAMGDVYVALHPRLPKSYALKVLRPDLSGDADYRARFEREANLAAALDHRHIVGVHERGDYEGQLWISMDFADGSDAAEMLASRYPAGMPTRDVLKIITAVAAALDYAHQHGVLHRDVKPANILLPRPDADSGRIMLGDFGIARPVHEVSGLTATNMVLGTVFYAAPEQLMDEALDGRADQYALATTAYELLCGSVPFQHPNPAVVIVRKRELEAPPLAGKRPELASLHHVMAIALSKNPRNRFPTCIDFARALKSSERQETWLGRSAAQTILASAPPKKRPMPTPTKMYPAGQPPRMSRVS